MRHRISLMLPPHIQETLERCRNSDGERSPSLDEQVDTFYSCIICQSYVPYHLCMIKPEKRGICGNYTWHDARIISTHHPRGPFRAVKKKQCLDPERGEWRGVNEAVRELSCGRTDRWSAYSILDHPETSCRCGECMAAIIPEAQGFMIAHHDYRGLTPAGFTYAELLETAGRGRQVPGFMGFDETFPLSRRFMGAEGGLSRIVWMPAELKEKLRHAAMGTPGECDLLPLIGRAADETDADTLRDLLKFLEHTHHPALSMPALF